MNGTTRVTGMSRMTRVTGITEITRMTGIIMTRITRTNG